MRASKSSIQCRIFLFHCGGMIWRTSARFSKFVIRYGTPLYELRKTKGTGKSWILVPLFDLKFLFELAARGAATSNRRHTGPRPVRSDQGARSASLAGLS